MNVKIFFIVFLLSAGLACQHQEKAKKPNIVLFLVDDLGWQDCSVPFWEEETNFNKLYHTPNMERLARSGVLCSQAYATPVCTPSRVSLLTGMNAARHRVTNWTLYKDSLKPVEAQHPTLTYPTWNVNGLSAQPGTPHTVFATPLPEILRASGYHTIICGKSHFGALGTPGADPTNLGFDVNIGGHAAGAPMSYLGTDRFGNQGADPPVWAVPGLSTYHGRDIYLTEALTREALSSVDKKIKDAPIFLYMSHYAVHVPIMADHRFVDTYYAQGMDSVEAAYASMIEGVDKSLGDVLDYLEDAGELDNTVLIFYSDNGGLSAVSRGGTPHTHNKPLSSGKGSMHEGGIRVPMLVYWPDKIKASRRSSFPIAIEDLFPTILEIAGVSVPELPQKIDGQSIVTPLLSTSDEITPKPMIWHYPNLWGPNGPGIGTSSCIREGNWKLIYYHSTQNFELFNLKEDIGETNNLVAKNPTKLESMAKNLSLYLRSVDAQMPRYRESGLPVPWPDEAITLNRSMDEQYQYEHNK